MRGSQRKTDQRASLGQQVAKGVGRSAGAAAAEEVEREERQAAVGNATRQVGYNREGVEPGGQCAARRLGGQRKGSAGDGLEAAVPRLAPEGWR